MRIIELVLDELSMANGIDAISIVGQPAIEENFIALKSQAEYKFATINEEKRLLLGPALIPNKPIYRVSEDGEFYVYFSRKTIRQANELYHKRGKQQSATLEHEVQLQGTTVVESWITEDKEKDKSKLYGYDVPLGTWMIAMKIDNDEVWNQYVKSGEVAGFSIEGYFVDKMQRDQQVEQSKQMDLEHMIQEINEADAAEQLEMLKSIVSKTGVASNKIEMYTDYPKSVRNNAKRGIALNEKNGNKCATQTGKVRAQQLAQGKSISVQTIKRMYSYLSRAEVYYDAGDTSSCGTISYLLWGGKSALGWSRNKLRELGQLKED